MIPYLFPSDALSFEGMGYGALTRAVSCEVRQELGSTGVYELNMEILTDDPNFKNMEIGKIIVAKPNFTDVNQAFVIESMSKPINNVVSVYATHIAQHRAKLIPVSPVNATSLSDAITKIAANSQETNPFTLHTSRTVNVAYKTVKPMSFREILGGTQGSLLDVYGGEYIFNNLDIELVNKRGRTNGIQVVYGQNMTDFNLDEEFSYSETITGILPYWYSENDGLVQGSVQYSDYVDFFKYHKTVAKDYTENFQNKPTAAELESIAAREVKHAGYPSVNMAISFNDFNEVIKGDTKIMQLGDTVKVINSNYMVNTEARIVSMLFNVLADRFDEIQVGALSQSINEAISDIGTDVNVDISTKMNLVLLPTANDILITDSNGQAVDSGKTLNDLQDKLTAGAGINITSGGVISNRFANLTGVDLNTVKYNCLVWCNDACTNLPKNYGGLLLSCFSSNNSSYGVQIFTSYAISGKGTFYRRHNGGTWADWVQFPEITTGTQTVQGTYCTVVANWVQEGNICSVYGTVTPSTAISSSTGNVTISNLPSPSTYTFFTAGTSVNSFATVDGRLTSSSVMRFNGTMTSGTAYYFNFTYAC